jgi:hypothetical protein
MQFSPHPVSTARSPNEAPPLEGPPGEISHKAQEAYVSGENVYVPQATPPPYVPAPAKKDQ